MRIAIVGVGGVGGYFGGRLARAGHDVAFVARGAHLRALREEGLVVESVSGDFHLHPVRATDDPAEVGPVDAVLLAVKAWQVASAAAPLAPLLRADTAVVTLQNGVEAPARVAEVLGEEHVVPGIARIFSFVAGPGRIRHIGGPGSVAFAERDDRPSERVERLRAAFREAGVAVETPRDIQAALWTKLLFVVPIGGVGSVTRAPVGVMRSLPGTRAMLEEAMREIERVARARGISLPDDVVARSLEAIDAQPAAGTSSLQRDIGAGNPSELEAWTGAVVRLGREAGVPTPLHDYLYASLLPGEMRARGEVEYPE